MVCSVHQLKSDRTQVLVEQDSGSKQAPHRSPSQARPRPGRSRSRGSPATNAVHLRRGQTPADLWSNCRLQNGRGWPIAEPTNCRADANPFFLSCFEREFDFREDRPVETNRFD